jgi:hypothetical protein
MGDDEKAHQGVGATAIFGADASIGSGPVGLDADEVAPPWHHVELAGELRHPEAVDHVGRDQLDRDRAADRDVKLVGVLHERPAALVEIGDAPPPHLAAHPHAELRPAGRLREVPGEGQAPDQERGEDDDREDHPTDPYHPLAAEPRAQPVRTAQRDPQGGQHDQEDADGQRDQYPGEGGDRAGIGPRRVEYRRRPAGEALNDPGGCRDTRRHRATPFR